MSMLARAGPQLPAAQLTFLFGWGRVIVVWRPTCCSGSFVLATKLRVQFGSTLRLVHFNNGFFIFDLLALKHVKGVVLQISFGLPRTCSMHIMGK